MEQNSPTRDIDPLERFGLPRPTNLGLHAECTNLIHFLDEAIGGVYSGKTSIVELKTDIECARAELDSLLPICIDDYNEKNPF